MASDFLHFKFHFKYAVWQKLSSVLKHEFQQFIYIYFIYNLGLTFFTKTLPSVIIGVIYLCRPHGGRGSGSGRSMWTEGGGLQMLT